MFKIRAKKTIKWVIVPLLLLFLAIIFSVIYYFNIDDSPQILTVNHSSSTISTRNGVISAQFKAPKNYLGAVGMQFQRKVGYSGKALFEIWDVLNKSLHYESTVSASQFNSPILYDFGLPVISSSKSRIFGFNLHLLDTTIASPSLLLHNEYPTLVTKYIYPANFKIYGKSVSIEIILDKIMYYAFDESTIGVFPVYCLPIALYFMYLVLKDRYVFSQFFQDCRVYYAKIISPIFIIIFVNIIIDIFVIQKSTDSTFYNLTFLMAVGMATYSLSNKYPFSFALLFLSFCPFLLFAKMEPVAEKSAIWAYMFLVLGTIYTLFEFFTVRYQKSQFMRTINYLLSCISVIDLLISEIFNKIKHYAFLSYQNFTKILIIIVSSLLIFILLFSIYNKIMGFRDRQLKNPGTPIIEPTLVYPGTKVVLYGDRFGDGVGVNYALMKDGVRIRPDYWEDHKIIFTIPLSWKQPGEMLIWIEKPIDWHSKLIIEKTKPITIRLLKVTDQFTPDDELYFKQMKTWRNETKALNGYK